MKNSTNSIDKRRECMIVLLMVNRLPISCKYFRQSADYQHYSIAGSLYWYFAFSLIA
jgi:UPF0288 family protein (methanogenesis marker protein 3)